MRKTIHELSRAYGLHSRSQGTGAKRFTIITKKGNKRYDREKVAQVVGKYMRENSPKKSPANGKKKGGKAIRKDEKATIVKHGTVVGGDAPVIDSSNVGHKLLSKMGWKPGQGIGEEGEGRVNPVEAVVRAKRRGLGA